MDIKYNHEKILIVIALFLCSGIIFYNAFYIPEISIPSVIYVKSDNETSDNTNNSSETASTTSGSTSSNDNNTDGNTNTENNATNTESSNNTSSSSTKTQSKVNINTATEAELSDNLTGIGPTIAKRIVDYRNTHGKFNTIEEIKNVSGIGDKTFEKFKDNIYV